MCQRSTSVLVCSALQVYVISGRCQCAKTFPVTNMVIQIISQTSHALPFLSLWPHFVLLLVSEHMWSLHRGLLWPSHLRSWPHLFPLLSILLPWLILFTGRITIWYYFSHVFSFLFIVYFHPGKCELYEAGIFYFYCDFSRAYNSVWYITGF